MKVDTTGLEKMLKGIQRKDLPKAVRNTLRDIMKDTIRRESTEISRVFDRPVAAVKRGVRIKERPETGSPWGSIGFSESFGKLGKAVLRAVSPHIPGEPATRNQKGMASALTSMGLMERGQFLVPSRSMKLNVSGNITPGMARKMLLSVSRPSASGKWIWAVRRTKSGGTVAGIWDKKKLLARSGDALKMMVVDATPRYAKRFRFHQVAESWGKKVAPQFARKSVDYYITKKYGR